MKKTTNFQLFYFGFIYLQVSILNGVFAQTTSCSDFQWKCKNGECIRIAHSCDGKVHCADGSDENAASCSAPNVHIRCLGNSFQCAYGACIDGSQKCNGKKDCADNSDEAPSLCGTNASVLSSTNCSTNFLCDSGECISKYEACDGKRDCRDGSDETVKRCSSTPCPSFSFKCGYGACINGNSKCNGINDCADGSDETKQLCGPTHQPPPVDKLLPPDDEETPPIREPPTQSTPPGDSCIVKVTPNMIVFFEYDKETSVQDGTQARNFAPILFKCRKNYVLFGVSKNICYDGAWLHPYPECSKTCPPNVLDGVTFKVECEYDNKGVDCSGPIRPGTKAKTSCSVGYKKQNRPIQDTLVCQATGEWDYYPASCEPECGQETVIVTPFVNGGDTINITSVPWHTAIYRTDNEITYICGGSIINAKVVLTAAHCFKESRDEKRYTIVVGKVFSNFNAKESLDTQLFNISAIHIPSVYMGDDTFFHNDVAVLVLNKFIRYRTHIKPICLEWFPFNQYAIRTGTVGKVVGWGRQKPNGPISEELRSVDLSAISRDDCLKKVSLKYKPFVTDEKFCVGSEEGEGAACQGDSGGGFVESKYIEGIPTYFLRGVLSISLSPENCGNDFYVTFTNIQYHRAMISGYESQYRPK